MLALSDYLGQDVVSADGARLGRLADLAVRLDEPRPPVTRLRVRTGRRAFVDVPWEAVSSFERSGVELAARAGEVPESPLADDELCLARHVLDTQVFDVAGRRLTRVEEVRLVRENGRLRLVAVDVGAAALLRRLGLRFLVRGTMSRALDWHDLQLTSGRGYALHLRAPEAGVRRLAPAELAELVSRLPLERGVEVLGAIESPRAARALAAALPRLSGRLVGELHPERAAPIVEAMPVDDAAAALRHLRREQLEELLAAVPSERAAELRRLLAYPAQTAGGLMTARVRTARPGEPAQAVRERLAADPPALEALATVFVVDEAGRVQGAIAPSALLVGEATPVPVPVVRVDTPVDDVIDLFAVHDVLALPVVDASGRLVGAVAVDDVLEELLVERLPGRRRFGIPSIRRRAPA